MQLNLGGGSTGGLSPVVLISSWASSTLNQGGSWDLLWPRGWGRSSVTSALRLGFKKRHASSLSPSHRVPGGLRSLKKVNHFALFTVISLLSCSVSGRIMDRRDQKAKYEVYLCQHQHLCLPFLSGYTPSDTSDSSLPYFSVLQCTIRLGNMFALSLTNHYWMPIMCKAPCSGYGNIILSKGGHRPWCHGSYCLGMYLSYLLIAGEIK